MYQPIVVLGSDEAAGVDAQREVVSAARWVSIADVAALDTPAELPALVADAAQWTQGSGYVTGT